MDLISEIESGVSFQLQKLAVLTEILIVNQGHAVMPLTPDKQGNSPCFDVD